MLLFESREDAGNQLAKALEKFSNKKNTLVLALPRGGVVLGVIVAKTLQLPLDLIAPRKLKTKENPEFAIGAICEEVVILNDFVKKEFSEEFLKNLIEEEKKEEKRRLLLYRQGKKALPIKNQTVILIDDGIATGSTLFAAIEAVRKHNPKKIVVAVPVAPLETLEILEKIVEEVVCLHSPLAFMAISQFYKDFPQVEDDRVISLLKIFCS